MDNSFLLQILYFDTRSCCRWLNRAVAELCSALYRRCRQTNSLRVVGGRVAPHGCLGQRRDGLGLVHDSSLLLALGIFLLSSSVASSSLQIWSVNNQRNYNHWWRTWSWRSWSRWAQSFPCTPSRKCCGPYRASTSSSSWEKLNCENARNY